MEPQYKIKTSVLIDHLCTLEGVPEITAIDLFGMLGINVSKDLAMYYFYMNWKREQQESMRRLTPQPAKERERDSFKSFLEENSNEALQVFTRSSTPSSGRLVPQKTNSSLLPSQQSNRSETDTAIQVRSRSQGNIRKVEVREEPDHFSDELVEAILEEPTYNDGYSYLSGSQEIVSSLQKREQESYLEDEPVVEKKVIVEKRKTKDGTIDSFLKVSPVGTKSPGKVDQQRKPSLKLPPPESPFIWHSDSTQRTQKGVSVKQWTYFINHKRVDDWTITISPETGNGELHITKAQQNKDGNILIVRDFCPYIAIKGSRGQELYKFMKQCKFVRLEAVLDNASRQVTYTWKLATSPREGETVRRIVLQTPSEVKY